MEENEKIMQKIIRRFMKIACITLNEQFGFGKKRLAEFEQVFYAVAEEHEHDEEYWVHADIRCKQLGMQYNDEDYDELGEFKKIREKVRENA